MLDIRPGRARLSGSVTGRDPAGTAPGRGSDATLARPASVAGTSRRATPIRGSVTTMSDERDLSGRLDDGRELVGAGRLRWDDLPRTVRDEIDTG